MGGWGVRRAGSFAGKVALAITDFTYEGRFPNNVPEFAFDPQNIPEYRFRDNVPEFAFEDY